MMAMDRIARIWRQPWVPPAMGKLPYLWLMSLLFLLFKYAYRRPEPVELVLLGLTVLVFLPLYFYGFWARNARTVLVVLTVCLIGVLWIPYNYGASTFFIFAAGMCAGIESQRRAYMMVALVLGLAVLSSALAGFNVSFLLPALAIGLPVGIGSVMDARVRRSRVALMRKQEEVEHMATIAERERISRDLHDLLGHTLSMITLKAELAGKLLDRDPEACRREIADIENSARQTLGEVRSAVTGYRQSGLAHALATARASLSAANVQLDERVTVENLPPAAEHVVALALREAVTNIVRHAGASRCELTLTLEGNMIVLRVADDGTALSNAASIRQGNGLTGMRERVAGAGGKLALRVERGLALELSLPLRVGA